MPQLLPVDLPPGFYRHGVELESAQRWRLGNFVRWQEGAMMPVGGWVNLLTPGVGGGADVTIPLEVARASHGWLSNSNEPHLAVGTNSYLYAADVNLNFEDITPAGFQPGVEGENLGYGGKLYGRGFYGTPRLPDGVIARSSVWSLDNFGEILLACTSGDNTLYKWELDTGAVAVEVAAAPTMDYMLVTAERFVFALAADGNPRRIEWCDRENFDDWTPSAVNEAGGLEIQAKGSLQGACKVRGRTLILTEYDAWVATYQGPPIVYGFQQVGAGTGLASPRALVSAGPGAFWMGADAFFGYDGSVAERIPCTVLDHVFQNINRLYIRNAWGVANESHQEVWWFYPSSGSLECDRYVAYDYKEGHWIVGEIARGTGIDVGVYEDPIWFDNMLEADGPVYRHETGNLHDGVQPFAESGPIMLGIGDNVFTVTNMLQDQLTSQDTSGTFDNANLEVSFNSLFWADDVKWQWGPYQLGNPTNVRLTGRQARMKIVAEDGKNWRLGGMRLEYDTRGRR